MSTKKTAKKPSELKKSLSTLVKNSSFLPRGYELPKPESQYVSLEEGDTRLRILSPAVIGWEAWIDGVAHRTEGADNPFDEACSQIF